MIFEVTTSYGKRVRLRPSVALYRVEDFMGKELPGLAIVLDEVGKNGKVKEEYAVFTISFGEFIGMKNCAYIDTNNCSFAEQLLDYGIAKPTGFTKASGFCSYPLWQFDEAFLKDIGGECYEKYSKAYEEYMRGTPIGRAEKEDRTSNKKSLSSKKRRER